MQVNIVKIYACKIATNNSNPIIITIKETGNNPATPMSIAKVPKTFSKTCPATMFPAKRIDKLIGLTKKENSSIKIMSGAIYMGVPCGIKSEKNLMPCFINPVIITIKKTNTAKARVMMSWPVTVNPKGNRPIIFRISMKEKIVKTKGANFLAEAPAASVKVLFVNSNKISAKLCNLLGIIEVFLDTKKNNNPIAKMAINMHIAEFVKLTS